MKSECFEHALRYADRGMRVIPLRGKTAFTSHGVLDATTDRTIIAEWWGREPRNNVGWAIGTDYWVLDVDPRHNGDDTLESLVLKNGQLPDTLQQVSGSGGRHFVFKRPPNINLRQSTGMIGPGLDVKTGAGYIVVAPSIHPDTGKAYFWDGLTEFEEQPILPAPAWLLALAMNNGKPAIDKTISETIPKGKQHATLVSFAGTMRNRGATEEEIFAAIWEMNKRCEVPGPAENIRQIARSAMQWPGGVPPRQTVNGGPEAAPQDEKQADAAAKAKLSALAYAEAMLVAVIESKDILQVYNAPLVPAMAGAGHVKQHEAKLRLKAVFGNDFSISVWQRLMREAEAAAGNNKHAQSPYILTGEGVMKPNVANAITMMQELPVAYNSFACRVFLTEPAPWSGTGNWTDNDDVKAAEWCQRQMLNIEKGTAADAAEAIARAKLPHHHPVTDYLRSLQWDGVPRLDHWLTTYLSVADSPYSRAVAAKWMIAAVKRVCEPGCQSDYTLVLEGDQGRRKSTALRVLAGDEWFSDDLADLGSKDSAMQLQGKWIVEVSELDAIRRVDMTTVKAWLVRRWDHFRPPYGRRTEDFPRQNVFAASTNKTDWLNDDTGGRRFWPVRVGRIDIEGLAAARNQLWAEAMYRYNQKELPYLSDTLEVAASGEQHERQEKDAWYDMVTEWIERPVQRVGITANGFRSRARHVYIPDIFAHCIGIPDRDWGHGPKGRIGRILTLAGYVKNPDDDGDGLKEYWTPRISD